MASVSIAARESFLVSTYRLPLAGSFCLFLFWFCSAPYAIAQESPYFVAYDHYLEEPGNLEIEYFSTFGTQRGGNDFHGVGWWATDAAIQLDAVSVLGVTLFSGALLILANLAVDIAYAFLDPRIRLD